MAAKPPRAPPPGRVQWVAAFACELMRLRPYLTENVAILFANFEWTFSKEREPVEAARQWSAERQ